MVKQPNADDLGESIEGPSKAVRIESDGTGEAGDAVTYNADGQVTPTAAAGELVVGVLFEDAPDAGDQVAVQVSGVVAGVAAEAIAEGDVTDTTATAGALGVSGATNPETSGQPFAMSDAAAGEPVALKLR